MVRALSSVQLSYCGAGMNASICLSINVYNDAKALAGALENGARFFDDILILHSGPGGAMSTDGTIELAEKFSCRILYDDIDRGFGIIRSRALHECGCTWAAILDADERFFPELPVLHVEGNDYWLPGREKPNLSVHVGEGIVNQGELVRKLMEDPNLGAIRASRRHWYDFTMKTPCRNWLLKGEEDHQLRFVRNIPEIGYKQDVAMHEKLWDSRRNGEPVYSYQDNYQGPFIDHFHTFYRLAYPGTKEAKERNYARLSRGEKMILEDKTLLTMEESIKAFEGALPK